jgi:enterochelin esterase-like enzyme
MTTIPVPGILIENTTIDSLYLQREVIIDIYLPKNVADPSGLSLLLINDGQNMEELGLSKMLGEVYTANKISPVLCVGIHANENRKTEYGMASSVDYHGRGSKAGAYTLFVIEELIPFIQLRYHIRSFREKAFAGFSLGGLMALDIVWNYPQEFSKAGIFSGSLWWRVVDQDDRNYNDDLHRLMHQQIKKGMHHPGQKFFFTTGSLDETKDRNNNGIIDSIDDTLSLIKEMEALGFSAEKDIVYINYPDGKHDVATWARAMPAFLKWGWPS